MSSVENISSSQRPPFVRISSLYVEKPWWIPFILNWYWHSAKGLQAFLFLHFPWYSFSISGKSFNILSISVVSIHRLSKAVFISIFNVHPPRSYPHYHGIFMFISMAVCGLWPEVLRSLLSVFRRWMDCPQWTVMSQLPASILPTLPPKCHPTRGTAAPRRPMWPAPHGSRPVAVLSLPTAVTSSPSRARLPRETPSTRLWDCTRGMGGSKREYKTITERNNTDLFILALSTRTNLIALRYLWKTCRTSHVLFWMPTFSRTISASRTCLHRTKKEQDWGYAKASTSDLIWAERTAPVVCSALGLIVVAIPHEIASSLARVKFWCFSLWI